MDDEQFGRTAVLNGVHDFAPVRKTDVAVELL
jgi:hypothetical protein